MKRRSAHHHGFKRKDTSSIPPAYRIEAQVLDASVILPDGHVRLCPAGFWRSLNPYTVRAWCHLRARYQVVTEELIAWLQDHLAGRTAIEIGGGAGDLGFHLGIPSTDSRVQDSLEFLLQAAMMGQSPVEYGENIVALEAQAAVEHYQPEVVIASWVTQKFDESKGDRVGEAEAFVHGVDEEILWATPCVREYLMLGNPTAHSKKRLLRHRHQELTNHTLGLVSRSKTPTLNRIYLWQK